MRKINKFFTKSFGFLAEKSRLSQGVFLFSRVVKPNHEKKPEEIKENGVKSRKFVEKTEETPAVFAKKPTEIEIFPDLLEENELVRAIQRVSSTIDQLFIKEMQATGEIPEERLKKLKKKLKVLPAFSLITLAKSLGSVQKQQKAENLWISLENEAGKRLKNMSFEEIVAFLCYYSFANRRNREFFRAVENELYDRDWNYVHISHIGKMLWAFSFADRGSSELYSKIANTIKLAQHELPPIKLAEFASYFSKSSENIQGGFGVYEIAEKKLTESLDSFGFHDLIRISSLLLPQNIGSNQFTRELERRIFDLFPNNERIPLPDLVKLAKAMVLFRNQSQEMRDKLENNVIKYSEFMSNSQIEATMWAFYKGNKGSKRLFQHFEREVLKRLDFFKARTLAFIYHGFASTFHGSAEFFDKLHAKILAEIESFNAHCLLKMIKATNFVAGASEGLRSQLFSRVLRMKGLKLTEMLKLLMIINESNIEISQENDALLRELFGELLTKFEENLHILNIEEICQVFYTYILHNKFNETQFHRVLQEIPNANSVPKPIFCQTLWAMVQCKNFAFAKEFIPIINNLKEFGDVKYFFDHDNFVKLSWSLIILQHNTEENSGNVEKNSENIKENQYFIDKNLWITVKEAMFDINPNTLKAVENVGLWLQTILLLNTVIPVDEREIQQKIHEISEYTKKNLANSLKLSVHCKETEAITDEIIEFIEKIFQENPIKGLEIDLFKNFHDDFSNFLDIALISKRNARLGVRVRSKRSYLFEDCENKELGLMKNDLNDRILENVFGWKLLIFDEEEYKAKSQGDKKLIIKKFLKNFK